MVIMRKEKRGKEDNSYIEIEREREREQGKSFKAKTDFFRRSLTKAIAWENGFNRSP